MKFTIVKHLLTRKNEQTYKQIFKNCFSETWRISVPFPKDTIIAALNDIGDVIGFCMVHNTTPYTMSKGDGAFMYNLCVDTKFRKQGVATLILKFVATLYPQVYAHVAVQSDYHDSLMARSGWKRIGIWREKYIEYCFGFDVINETMIPETLFIQNYDPDENVIYLS